MSSLNIEILPINGLFLDRMSTKNARTVTAFNFHNMDNIIEHVNAIVNGSE